jgi:hypothetical protein
MIQDTGYRMQDSGCCFTILHLVSSPCLRASVFIFVLFLKILDNLWLYSLSAIVDSPKATEVENRLFVQD